MVPDHQPIRGARGQGLEDRLQHRARQSQRGRGFLHCGLDVVADNLTRALHTCDIELLLGAEIRQHHGLGHPHGGGHVRQRHARISAAPKLLACGIEDLLLPLRAGHALGARPCHESLVPVRGSHSSRIGVARTTVDRSV
ncbi:Uncharacterised protein [Mycobacteroides abscessus subsp. massiliense]|nr:Uncharacterised protein [Mycobacteroides abscessus subsp. massiliense]